MRTVLIMLLTIESVIAVFAQNKIDEGRMQRDIEVAENILATLIKQQYDRRQFFPVEVQGSYLPGYGVTFRVPSGIFENMFFMKGGDDMWISAPDAPMPPGGTFVNGSANERYPDEELQRAKALSDGDYQRSKLGAKKTRTATSDSASNSFQDRILEAAKNFVADYGDLITQLQPNEKVVVTNKSEGGNFQLAWSGVFEKAPRQNQITVEGTKSDISQFRQGKISRDQLMKKLRIANNEIIDELQPDLELLSSILNRLYSSDLSKTFFSDGNIYYERLKDFGALYHMQVYASNQINSYENRYDMPTLRLRDIDQATRDTKVKQLYPEFEKGLKEDLLEYGRTIKSLNDNETLMWEVNLTRCPRCGIPSTVEVSIKNSILKDYATGKISKETALLKIVLKKGPEQ